jgi:hypothetical protein
VKDPGLVAQDRYGSQMIVRRAFMIVSLVVGPLVLSP